MPLARLIAVSLVTFMLLANRYSTGAISKPLEPSEPQLVPTAAADGRTLVYLPLVRNAQLDSKKATATTSEWIVLDVKVYPMPLSSQP